MRFVKNALVSKLEVLIFMALLTVLNADEFKDWMAAKSFQLPDYPFFLLYPAPKNFF